MKTTTIAMTIRASMAFGICFVVSVAWASKKTDLSGVYPHTHPNIIFNPETQQNDPIETEDCLELRSVWENQLAFHFYVYGANGHTCEMQGIAIKMRPSIYEYRERVGDDDAQDCVLRIHVSDAEVELEDSDNQCRAFCGVRAGFDGVKFPRAANAGRHQCRDWIK